MSDSSWSGPAPGVRVVASASSYNYGPTGPLLTVLRQLQRLGHEVHFCGEGAAYELAVCSGVDSVRLPSSRFARAEALAALAVRADVVLSSMEPLIIAVAQRRQVPTVWLDSFAWWSEVVDPPAVHAATARVLMRSLQPTDPSLDRFAGTANTVDVGPILPEPTGAPRGAGLVLNLGGVEPHRTPDVEHVVSHLWSALWGSGVLSRAPKLTVAGAPWARAFVAERARSCGVQLAGQDVMTADALARPLAHAAFLAAVEEARLVITAPGLAAPLESWSLRTPVAFTPPFNWSQELQLAQFVERGLAPPDTCALRSREKLPEQLALMVREVQRLILSPQARRAVTGRGSRFLAGLGGNGLADAVDIVLRVARRERAVARPRQVGNVPNATKSVVKAKPSRSSSC